MATLPEDVLPEILKRLTIRILLKFSCIAKSWNTLIFSHFFSKKHLQYSKDHSNFQQRMMLRYSYYELKHFSLHNAAVNGSMVRVLDIKNPYPECTFIGSCDGLICMVTGGIEGFFSGSDIILWNPSIHKLKSLPGFGVEKGYEFRTYGFGYNESGDDYNIVGFYSDLCNVLVKIYSMKTSELKIIKNHFGLLNSYPPTFANGKLHWFGLNRDIAYLDLATEEYGVLEKPDNVNLEASCVLARSAGGRLYVSYLDGEIRRVWLVDGTGKTNWTSGYDFEPEKFRGPLFKFNNDELVFLNDTKILVLNLMDRPNYQSSSPSDPQDFLHGIAYVESLVSPLMTGLNRGKFS